MPSCYQIRDLPSQDEVRLFCYILYVLICPAVPEYEYRVLSASAKYSTVYVHTVQSDNQEEEEDLEGTAGSMYP